MPNATLIEDAQSGDKKALNELINLWYPRIYNFAYKYFADETLAGEVAQRTFISVYQNLKNLKQIERFRAWLYQIASNYCHEEQRKKQKKWTISWFQSKSEDSEDTWELPIEDRAIAANPETQFQQGELADLLEKALTELPEEQRIVVIMKEYEGLKFIEIAEILKISENTAKSRLYYGLKALKKILTKWNINQETIYYER